jgi:hypothetical protein
VRRRTDGEVFAQEQRKARAGKVAGKEQLIARS